MREIDVTEHCVILELNDKLFARRIRRDRLRIFEDVLAFIALIGFFAVTYSAAVVLEAWVTG